MEKKMARDFFFKKSAGKVVGEMIFVEDPGLPPSPSNTWTKPHGPSERNTRSRGHSAHLHQPETIFFFGRSGCPRK